ncbi:DUF2130 domain-containing protein [Chitinophaga sp. GCM10012297]|uniref:DUF2130 domain-containing protein n=1 Tax=Chitinophaga chungangae TaxID=2821488 RepID=A0ABS3Y942_9BACT|nr:DUF2130 domain-containing protein [Chitinophaga chungangae]MBO9151200.1 DUF2130 domain-containing protein [Chitinophaga chungangae]
MGTSITCPACKHHFVMEDAFAADIEREMRTKMAAEWRKKLDELQAQKNEIEQQTLAAKNQMEKERQQIAQDRETILRQRQQQDEELGKRLQAEKIKLQEQMSASIRKDVAADFENQLQLLRQSQQDNEEKLKEARLKELEFLKKAQDLQNREQELELSLQKRILEERTRLTEQIRKDEAERNNLKETEHQMRIREMEKQLEDQRRLAEEMRRKAEQGSMQLQGEVQELALEEMLRATFPFDAVSEVGKGVRGADCIQTVRNQYGQECGKIIYESKRTSSFSPEWIEKLKADMRSQGADVAVLVTRTMPPGFERFGEKEGVWICSFHEVKSLTYVLRDAILKIYSSAKSQENKGDKMHLLYHYLTSGEFAEQWSAIREGFRAMKASIQKEREAMEKLWKAREKQLEKVLLNAAHIKGSIEGIAGSDSVDLQLLDEAADALLTGPGRQPDDQS